MPSRRSFLKTSAGGLLVASAAPLLTRVAGATEMSLGPAELPSGTFAASVLEALPGKLPLIKKTYRPPNFETPVNYFNEPITPNRAFFVRYHLSSIPEVDARAWRLRIGGDAAGTPVELTLDDLKRDFPAVEVVAVCQCSGNRRGMFEPHVPGVEWGPGAMGNARWKGARLKDVLARAGIKKEALEVVFDGSDTGPIAATPDFVKSIPIWKALDENTIIAYEMNGEPLPHWNGFPARIVVPGWTATYWMKHVVTINVVSRAFDGFWMKSAYRIPKGKFPLVDRFLSQETEVNTPITEMVVNSLITNLAPGQRVKAGQPLVVAGVSWDGGYGIARVEVSADGGESWQRAELQGDLGRFSFRSWRHVITPAKSGPLVVAARATNRAGAAQTFDLVHNPAGYHHNVVQRVAVEAV